MKMKMTIVAGLSWLAFALEGFAGAIPVVDVGLIKTNLLNAKRDFAEQLVHGQRALQQVQHLRSGADERDAGVLVEHSVRPEVHNTFTQ